MLFILIGCTHEDDSLKKNNSLQSFRQSLVKDIMKAGKEYSKISKDSAFQYYSKAILLAHRNHVEEVKPEIFYRLAMLYENASDLKMSAIYLDSALNSAREINNYEWVSNSYNALGDLKFSVLDSAHAKLFFDSAYKIANKHSLRQQLGISLANLSKFEKNPLNMIEMLKAAARIMEGVDGSGREVGMIYVNLGYVFSNPDSVLKYSKLAVENGLEFNSPEVEIAGYNNMAYSYLEKREYDKAEDCLRKYAIPLAQDTRNFDWLSTLYDTYGDIYSSTNRYLNAFLAERQALQFRKKADEVKSLEQVQLLSSLLDLKNKELLIQKKEGEIQIQEKVNHDLLFWGIMIILGLVVISSLWIWRQQKNKIRIQSELILAAKRLISIEETIKGRVSMELHDLVTPFYHSMLQKLESAGINNEKAENEIREKVFEFTNALRDLSHYMHNISLDNLRLSDHLKNLCNDYSKTMSLKIKFSSNVNGEFSNEITLHLYRICQELLANALKYASSSDISISLTKDFATLFLLYSDTGPGFDSNTKQGQGIGNQTIQERIKLIHGNAILSTSPGEGTEWTITVPIV